MKRFIYRTADAKLSKLWSLQLRNQFLQLAYIEVWKSQHFNGVWPRDLVKPVRRANQLSYEAADVGSWFFGDSNEPVKTPLKSWLFKVSIQVIA